MEYSKLPFPKITRVKGGSSLSEWLEIIFGVPQRSILGPIFFIVFTKVLILFIKETDICKFADDTTLYYCGKDFIPNKLELETNTAIKWLKDNEMVPNTSKFQLMVLSNYKKIEKNMSFDGKNIKLSDTVELLAITLTKISISKYLSQSK